MDTFVLFDTLDHCHGVSKDRVKQQLFCIYRGIAKSLQEDVSKFPEIQQDAKEAGEFSLGRSPNLPLLRGER